MKKILVVLLIICLLIIGYMYVTKDVSPDATKVYNWAKEYIPEQVAKSYKVTAHDVIKNEDGSIDVMLHFEKGAESGDN